MDVRLDTAYHRQQIVAIDPPPPATDPKRWGGSPYSPAPLRRQKAAASSSNPRQWLILDAGPNSASTTASTPRPTDNKSSQSIVLPPPVAKRKRWASDHPPPRTATPSIARTATAQEAAVSNLDRPKIFYFDSGPTATSKTAWTPRTTDNAGSRSSFFPPSATKPKLWGVSLTPPHRYVVKKPPSVIWTGAKNSFLTPAQPRFRRWRRHRAPPTTNRRDPSPAVSDQTKAVGG